MMAMKSPQTISALALPAVVFLLFSGCGVGQYTAKTTANFVRPDGTRFEYFNEKDLAGAEIVYELDEKGGVKNIRFKLDKSGTPEAAIGAAMQSNAAMAALLQQLMPLAMKAAAMGSGS